MFQEFVTSSYDTVQGRSRLQNVNCGLLLMQVMNLITCILCIIDPSVTIFIFDYICLSFCFLMGVFFGGG